MILLVLSQCSISSKVSIYVNIASGKRVMLYTFDHDETGTSEDIDFFSLSLSSFVLIEEGKKSFLLFPRRSLSKLTNFLKCTFNVYRTNASPTNRTQQEEGRKWVGDEIDAMTDNILSTLFSSREGEFVGKEITKSTRRRRRRRTLE